jgi:hypothetical protein
MIFFLSSREEITFEYFYVFKHIQCVCRSKTTLHNTDKKRTNIHILRGIRIYRPRFAPTCIIIQLFTILLLRKENDGKKLKAADEW